LSTTTALPSREDVAAALVASKNGGDPGALSFTLVMKKGERLDISTLGSILTDFDKVLRACERAATKRRSARLRWMLAKFDSVTVDDIQTVAITVRAIPKAMST
jgi:hypothetical protein